MIHGKPVITHRSSMFNGQEEIVSNGGFFVNNEEEYLNCMLKLIDDKNLYNELSKKSFEIANSKYRIDVVTRQLENYYFELFK